MGIGWMVAGVLAGAGAALAAAWQAKMGKRAEEAPATLKGNLEAAVEDAWGQEESTHWMREWCPGCSRMWHSLALSGICAWCCAGGPDQPDRPAFYEDIDLTEDIAEGEDAFEIDQMY